MPENVPLITRDPNLEEMPDFDSETFKAAFNPLVTEENTLESIVQKAKDAWSADHQKRCACCVLRLPGIETAPASTLFVKMRAKEVAVITMLCTIHTMECYTCIR